MIDFYYRDTSITCPMVLSKKLGTVWQNHNSTISSQATHFTGRCPPLPKVMVLTVISGSTQAHKTLSMDMMLSQRSVVHRCLFLLELISLGDQLERIGVDATAPIEGNETKSGL